MKLQSALAQSVTLLAYIPEMPDSKFGREPTILKTSALSSVVPGKYWNSTLKENMTTSFHIYSNSLLIFHRIIR
jgi:hypothetical protein